MYYIDYNAASLVIDRTDGEPPELAQNTKRFTANDAGDLDAMGSDTMMRCLSALGHPVADKLPPEPSDLMWKLLGEVASFPVGAMQAIVDDTTQLGSLGPAPGEEPPPTKPEKKNRKRKKKDLQAPDASATSAPTEGDAPPVNQQEQDMAKNTTKPPKGKKATKKAAKAKTQAPRKDTKKDKLIALCQKDGGATMAQMLGLTGWKACRGTLGTEAAKRGLKITVHKDPEGKKATRWEVSKK